MRLSTAREATPLSTTYRRPGWVARYPCKQAVRHAACHLGDDQCTRSCHRVDIGGKRRPVRWKTLFRNPEQGREEPALGVVALTRLSREAGQHKPVREKRRVPERRVHPA